jgi:hypothetical protein
MYHLVEWVSLLLFIAGKAVSVFRHPRHLPQRSRPALTGSCSTGRPHRANYIIDIDVV